MIVAKPLHRIPGLSRSTAVRELHMIRVVNRRFLIVACLFVLLSVAREVAANEMWVEPTYQSDTGGLGVASNTLWPVTPIGAVRLAWAIPADLQTFQSAKIVLIPSASSLVPVLTFYLCPAQSSQIVTVNCAGPFTQTFTSTANQLLEIDMSAAVGAHLGTPGASYLSVLAYTTPTTSTDHIVGLRFAYTPKAPGGVPTLAANTFTGTQTAPAFAGDGSGLTNVPLPAGAATLGANTFSGTQTAPLFVGSGAGLTSLPVPLGAAQLNGGNSFAGTQSIASGNLTLDNSTTTTGVVMKGGVTFLHNFGTFNTFLGLHAGNLTMTGQQNTATGDHALAANTTGVWNTANGASALTSNITGSGNNAVGLGALSSNTTGMYNIADGFDALVTNTTGGFNVATGVDALHFNVTGSFNVAFGNGALQSNTGSNNAAIGQAALVNNTTGNNNTALGYQAGQNASTGSNNIYLGANVHGVAGESNTIYLGQVGTQTKTFVAGVRGTTTGNADAIPVVIDSAGQLGTAPSVVGSLLRPFGSSLFLGSSAGTPSAGIENTGIGGLALSSLNNGGHNIAVGDSALQDTTTGFDNTAVGWFALFQNQTGNGNVAIGSNTGYNNTSGSYNIYLGAGNPGIDGETHTMYLGYGQSRALIAGVRGVTTGAVDAVPVVIDSNGQLGTISSSIRFKEDVQDMADASHRLFSLRPVTFRYTKPYTNGAKPIQFGLVAEEVAQVFPELVVHDAAGNVETFHYETLNVLLLNEVQRQERRIGAQQQQIEDQRKRIDTLEQRLLEMLASK